MQKYPFSVIVTSYNEPELIKIAIKKLIIACEKYSNDYEIIVMAGDELTYKSAQKIANNAQNIKVINDEGNGKPNALNLAYQNAKNEILVLTDGDVEVDENSISELFAQLTPDTYGVSGHPISVEDKKTMFGYYSHLFCESANYRRNTAEFTPMSGYLLLLRKTAGLFPIPAKLRAEDAYISQWLYQSGFDLKYAKNALVYVKFPKNLNDWVKQKTRSLGGNVQLDKFTANLPQNTRSAPTRSISQDFRMILFPIKYAKDTKEVIFSILLYPIRLYLWTKIYIIHCLNLYKSGRWEVIHSSKS